MPLGILYCFHGVGGDADGAIASGETVTLPDDIDFVVLGEDRGEFTIGFHHEPERFDRNR